MSSDANTDTGAFGKSHEELLKFIEALTSKEYWQSDDGGDCKHSKNVKQALCKSCDELLRRNKKLADIFEHGFQKKTVVELKKFLMAAFVHSSSNLKHQRALVVYLLKSLLSMHPSKAGYERLLQDVGVTKDRFPTDMSRVANQLKTEYKKLFLEKLFENDVASNFVESHDILFSTFIGKSKDKQAILKQFILNVLRMVQRPDPLDSKTSMTASQFFENKNAQVANAIPRTDKDKSKNVPNKTAIAQADMDNAVDVKQLQVALLTFSSDINSFVSSLLTDPNIDPKVVLDDTCSLLRETLNTLEAMKASEVIVSEDEEEMDEKTIFGLIQNEKLRPYVKTGDGLLHLSVLKKMYLKHKTSLPSPKTDGERARAGMLFSWDDFSIVGVLSVKGDAITLVANVDNIPREFPIALRVELVDGPEQVEGFVRSQIESDSTVEQVKQYGWFAFYINDDHDQLYIASKLEYSQGSIRRLLEA